MKHKLLTLTLIVLFMLLFCVNIVTAEQQSLGTYKRGECVNLIQTCANCTYVNFTSVYYPNSSELIGNTNTTKDNTVFLFQICNTTSIGTYIVNGVGDVDGTDTIFAYDFEVTPNGKKESNSPVSFSIALFFIVFNVGLFILFFMKEKYHESKYVNFIMKRALLVICVFFTMFNLSIITTLGAASNYDLMNQMHGFMDLVGWIGYVAIIILVITSMFQLFAEAKGDQRERRTGD